MRRTAANVDSRVTLLGAPRGDEPAFVIADSELRERRARARVPGRDGAAAEQRRPLRGRDGRGAGRRGGVPRSPATAPVPAEGPRAGAAGLGDRALEPLDDVEDNVAPDPPPDR